MDGFVFFANCGVGFGVCVGFGVGLFVGGGVGLLGLCVIGFGFGWVVVV